MTATAPNNNPLLTDWSSRPYSLPPFDEIEASHFKPAIEAGQMEHLSDLKQIAENSDPPTFDNTIKALDRAGGLLSRVLGVFHNLSSSMCLPELRSVERELVGPLADHAAATTSYPGLFVRIKHVHDNRDTAKLEGEQLRLVERIYTDFVRAGALFDQQAQNKYNAIVKELAQLMTTFRQNITADETEVTVPVTEEELVGSPDYIVQSARQAAVDRNLEGHVVTLARSMVEPFLTLCPNADARERVWREWNFRGELTPGRDNNPIAVRILELRIAQAKMHGFNTFAEYQTSDTMAKTPAAVMDLLERVWVPARDTALREREVLMSYAASMSDATPPILRPSDWRYYAEKVRASTFDLDDSSVKPYFSLDRMVEAVMDVAHNLYGLTFVHRSDIKAYHPDVRVYEVHVENEVIAIFLHDNFARPFKRGGAWMSQFRGQHRNTPDGSNVIPIVINNNNFTKGHPATLLSFNNVKTLFHEFGHGCHGMLSNATYKRLGGTQVPKDFVELPSQLMEHWMSQPQVLAKHARHVDTNEPIPPALLKKVTVAMKFHQGFATVEHVACTFIDQALHALQSVDGLDLVEFERDMLTKLGMPSGIMLRHRLPHFNHLFGASSYAAGYYVYLWAAVLDADAFEAFVEAGNIFDKDTADRARTYIYSSGNTRDQMEAYRAFRGRDPSINALMKKKGFVEN
ncbi:hypothetical protein H310_01176 [Aphanomyces invadans]|uniref:oligopeptidase A n=1 Tax=Aphanomyces invadans TaxID=157072 RepID=A0A024UR32_9STRA|nr:hypothetical protein H310_01176 [Aphanomyces invadans]ETW08640.1 hypothetical protein H310_01176 [Aphanomyces invadans]|eukprot:XP_008862445.1 hypothetical protein H310_01176 [Aphanomyces invadans]